MLKHKCHLIAALAFTVSAAAWLINCALDVAMGLPGSLPRHAMMAFTWTLGAALMWVRWGWEATRSGVQRCRKRD